MKRTFKVMNTDLPGAFSDEPSTRHQMMLLQQNYWLGFIPLKPEIHFIDIKTNFDDAVKDIASRKADNDNGYGGEKRRLLWGAAMTCAYQNMFKNSKKKLSTSDDKNAPIDLGKSEAQSTFESNAKVVKSDCHKKYDFDTLNGISDAVDAFYKKYQPQA